MQVNNAHIALKLHDERGLMSTHTCAGCSHFSNGVVICQLTQQTRNSLQLRQKHAY